MSTYTGPEEQREQAEPISKLLESIRSIGAAAEVVALLQAKIISGELMVVKTARIEGAKRACSSCGVEWPLLAIPAIGDHCICGAKIIP